MNIKSYIDMNDITPQQLKMLLPYIDQEDMNRIQKELTFSFLVLQNKVFKLMIEGMNKDTLEIHPDFMEYMKINALLKQI